MGRSKLHILIASAAVMWLASCSVYKYVPDGQHLLNKVEVTSDSKGIQDVSKFKNLSYQTPNSRWFGMFRFPLRFYSLTHTKSGEAPVLYDQLLSEATCVDMKRSLMNSGYLNAQVTYTAHNKRRPKTTVHYELHPGKMFVVDSVRVTIQDEEIRRIFNEHKDETLLVPGINLDASLLDDERNRIVSLVRRYGYYLFNRDFVSFVADTAKGSDKVGLRMIVAAESTDEDGTVHPHRQFTISSIDYVLSDENGNLPDPSTSSSIENYNGFSLTYPGNNSKPMLRPKILDIHSFLREGMTFNSDSISKTYSSLSRLGMLRYSDISPSVVPGSDNLLNVNVLLMSLPKHSFSFEVEGTNTAGDLGAAASLSFTNRNLFRGSEQLTIKLRGAYESISNLPGYTGDTYLEYGLEANLDFPEFLMPFMSQDL